MNTVFYGGKTCSVGLFMPVTLATHTQVVLSPYRQHADTHQEINSSLQLGTWSPCASTSAHVHDAAFTNGGWQYKKGKRRWIMSHLAFDRFLACSFHLLFAVWAVPRFGFPHICCQKTVLSLLSCIVHVVVNCSLHWAWAVTWSWTSLKNRRTIFPPSLSHLLLRCVIFFSL